VEEKDLYAVLGVPRGASEEDIRKAYRRLARKHHPDVNPNDPKAEERFKEISFASDVLLDPEKRKRYDEFGVAGLAQGFDPEQARAWQRWTRGARESPFRRTFSAEGDLGELFAELFGARMGGAPFGEPFERRPARGADVEGDVTVDFLDALRGAEVRVRVRRPDASGAGGEEVALKVRIPRGSADGTRIRLAGQGAPGPGGGPPGDLYLTLHVRPHPHFRREGMDLHLDLPVAIPELILGASVEIPTPEGSLTMRIPPRSQNGRKLRLRGKGVPHRRGEERGDLIVRLVARLPEGEDAAIEKIARELEPLYRGVDLRRDLKER
jgi:DnaJ-class molecular chaperone